MFNVAHVPLFAGLAWATLWAVPGSARLRALWVAAICIVFAVSDEVHQGFVPGRFFSWADLVADSAGIGFGVLFGLWTLPSITSRKGKPAI